MAKPVKLADPPVHDGQEIILDYRNAEIVLLTTAGYKSHDIATLMGITPVHVRRIQMEHRDEIKELAKVEYQDTLIDYTRLIKKTQQRLEMMLNDSTADLNMRDLTYLVKVLVETRQLLSGQPTDARAVITIDQSKVEALKEAAQDYNKSFKAEQRKALNDGNGDPDTDTA